jgi:hypothetical protein
MMPILNPLKTYHLSLEVIEGHDEFWNEVEDLPNKALMAAKVIESIQDELESRGLRVRVDLVKIEE